MNKKRQNLIALVGILSIAFITAGVSLAFFNYAKTGTDDNTISTGSITFIYDEESGQGRGITLTDAIPVSNALGKAEQSNVFNFRITSTPGNTNIKYTITARKVSDGSVLDDVVDLYLTDQSNQGDYIKDQYSSSVKDYLTFDDLSGYKNSSIEKVLYEHTITSADLTNGKYEQDFRLRMWIDENTDFSDGTYNNQIFRIIVNVNANVDTSVVVGNNEEEEILPLGSLRKTVLENYGGVTAIKANPTSSTDTLLATTDDDSETYYFNGEIEDNYVSFAGQLWRIMRINGDGTIKMILDTGINDNTAYKLNSTYNPTNSLVAIDNVDYLYYKNMDTGKAAVESWYNTTIDKYIEGNSDAKYSDYIATGKYCEAVKIGKDATYAGNANAIGYNMIVYSDSYQPTYSCEDDGKGNSYYYSKVALPTVDDILLAGGKVYGSSIGSTDIYLGDDMWFWTMSAMGFSGAQPAWWMALSNGLDYQSISSTAPLRPIINLKSNVKATGTGIKTDPFVITELYNNGETMISFTGQNMLFGVTEMPIRKGESIKISVKPRNGYYLSSVSCTTGYTATASTGINATASQLVTITRGNTDSLGTCTFTTQEKTYALKDKILEDNQLVTNNPTLNSTSNYDLAGLYSKTVTNGFGGQQTEGTTYYFRGNVTNNYVDFADLTWRIVRINEDGSVRLILDDDTVTLSSTLNASNTTENDLYYSNGSTSGTAQNDLATWYTNNIASKSEASYVLTGNYYCEQAKKTIHYSLANSSVGFTEYGSNPTVDLDCDSNKLVDSNIGLITYEESLYAGLYPQTSSSSYLSKNYAYLTMSPGGYVSNSAAYVWLYTYSSGSGALSVTNTDVSYRLRPVINLNANTPIVVNASEHYEVK